MQAIVQDKYGSAEVLELKEIERPEIGDHDVLVRVRAAGVNPADWALMNGLPYIARPAPLYGLRKPQTRVRGTDVAGTVEAVGSGVTRFQPGDEVFGSVDRLVRRVRGCRGGHAGDEARQPHIRAGGGRCRWPVTVALQAHSRSRQGRAGTEGADQRRLRGHRHLRGPDRQGLWVPRSPAVASTRNMDLLRSIGADHVIDYTHGGLHQERRAVRLHPRQRGRTAR